MVIAVIQARYSSSRLPGKVLMPLQNKSVLGHIFTRLKKCEHLDKIVLATSINSDDDAIAEECKKYGIACFRGSLNNVLERFYFAVKENSAGSGSGSDSDIVRVCADSPLLDFRIIDSLINFYKENGFDIASVGNVPLGLGSEIFSFNSLEKAFHNANADYQKEHVTPYIYENFNKGSLNYNLTDCETQFSSDYTKYRFTLDTKEDFELIKKLFELVYTYNSDFSLVDLVKCMEKSPNLYLINKDVEQVRVQLKR